MHVLYGVMGEGLGHAMRARVVTAALVARGHRVKITTSGRAVDVLRRHHDDVLEIGGLHLRYADGAVARGATLRENLQQTPRRLRHARGAALDAVRAFAPDVVITDFESFSHACGLLLRRPVVSLDHQHVVTLCRHPRAVTRALPRDFVATRAFIGGKTPGCAHYIVTSFFFPPTRVRTARRTTLVGPIVRPEIARARPTEGEHVLVYQTAHGDPALLPALAACADTRFVVYGGGSQPAGATRAANVTHRAFSEEGFVHDLASARAVIANGGFTTLGEAAFLGKPALSVPLRHQGEQQLNAAWLEHLALGKRCARPTALEIRRFLATLPTTRAGNHDPRLRSGNRDAIDALERVMLEVT